MQRIIAAGAAAIALVLGFAEGAAAQESQPAPSQPAPSQPSDPAPSQPSDPAPQSPQL